MSAEMMPVVVAPYQAFGLFERELSGRGELPASRRPMPILLAFGAIADVVFGGTGCGDLSVINVFLGLLVLLSSPRLSYGQDLAAGNARGPASRPKLLPASALAKTTLAKATHAPKAF
jgi:hypothetical protein